MGALELKSKLIEKFNLFLKDDSKLEILDGVFDAMNSVKSSSLISETQYKIVEERYNKYHAGQTKGAVWSEVKNKLKDKYGF